MPYPSYSHYPNAPLTIPPADYVLPEKQALANKTILITGAGDGIGKTIAIAYAQQGAQVILLGKTESKLDAVYDEIVAQGSPKPAIVPLDLAKTSPADCAQLHEMLRQEFTHLDGLVHNAAILGSITPIQHYDAKQWDTVMQINVNAAFYLTQALLPLLSAAEKASIIFTTSSVGRQGRAFWGAYAVSKFAIEGLAQVLHEELENTSTIRVNCLNPKATRTTMRATAYPAEEPNLIKTPDKLIPAYVYLMSDKSANMSGETLDA